MASQGRAGKPGKQRNLWELGGTEVWTKLPIKCAQPKFLTTNKKTAIQVPLWLSDLQKLFIIHISLDSHKDPEREIYSVRVLNRKEIGGRQYNPAKTAQLVVGARLRLRRICLCCVKYPSLCPDHPMSSLTRSCRITVKIPLPPQLST